MYGKIYIIVIATISSVVLRVQGFHSVVFMLLLALFYLMYRNKTNHILLITCLVSSLFFYLHPLYFKAIPEMPTNSSITAKIVSIPKLDGSKVSVQMQTDDNQTFQVNYFAKTELQKRELDALKYGMVCFLRGQYSSPPEPRNFYAFNYKEYLASRNIYYLFSPSNFRMKNCKEVRVTPYDLLQRYRQKGINYITKHFPENSKGIVTALIFGDKGEIDPDVLSSYQQLGIIHLLAVSGLHVGLISSSIYFILIRIGFTKELAVDSLLFILPIYALIAGAAASVLRAVAMTFVVLLCIKFRMRINPLDGISIVCLGLLLINPLYIFQLGFQLSFLISFTLIISAGSIIQQYSRAITKLLVVSLLAQIVSFPIIIYHFYEISLWSIPLNLIYIPFITFFILPLTFLSTILYMIFPLLGEILLFFYDFAISLAHSSLKLIEHFPLRTLIFGKPPLFIVCLYYLCLAYGLYHLERVISVRKRILCFGFFIAIAILHWNLPYFINEGQVTMIDVGQGDSILIELPKRQGVYLIDTGGNIAKSFIAEWQQPKKLYDVGEEILIPYLKARAIRKIDKLILTHGHFDHIGGAKSLIGNIKVENLLYSSGSVEGDFEKALLNQFLTVGTRLHYIDQEVKWQEGHNQFFVLDLEGEEENLNNRSLVLYTKIGGLYWLFTGDLEAEKEIELVKKYGRLHADVLKISHHGSNTSTTASLLEALKPKYALISVAKNNRYNHPHKEVLERLADRSITVLRTDLNGAIRYRFSERNMIFETMLRNEKKD